jgi:hypothetical protein
VFDRRVNTQVAALRSLIDSGSITQGIGARLPVVPALRDLLPTGISRDTPTLIGPGPGGRSLLLALLVEATRTAGAWCAIVGMPDLGLAAAAELGVNTDRLALVPDPGPDWAGVTAALCAGFDLVAVHPPARPPAKLAQRLQTKARHRHTALLVYGDWPAAHTTLRAVDGHWSGLRDGRGRLRRRKLRIESAGRGGIRPRTVEVWLPDDSGQIRAMAGDLQLVSRWWSGSWAGWARIWLRLEHGDGEWVVTQTGPSGLQRTTRHHDEDTARADVAQVMADHVGEWREVSDPDESAGPQPAAQAIPSA